MSFADKVVLVTGASSGIGAATAIMFAKEGANVVMVGRNQKKLDAVNTKVSSFGKKPLVINAELSKEVDVKRIITETVDKFGKLDVLVNNAGLGKNGTILGKDIIESYDVIMSVNVRAVINLTTLAAPYLVKSKGNVVNISSVASMTIPLPGSLMYNVSKAALDHFTRGAALELAASGVRVNSVNPGPVLTDFMENMGVTMDVSYDISQFSALNRISNPEEISYLILYLASEKAIGITGSCFVSDNGFLLKK